MAESKYIYNKEIADKFNKLADLLDIEGDNPFRVRAYRNAARMIANLFKPLNELVAQGAELTELPAIGKDLASKIKTIIETGELPALQQAEKRVPAVLTQLMDLEALGAKRVQRLYRELDVRTLNDLKKVINNGQLRKLKGFGAKLEEKIKASIVHIKEYQLKTKLADAMPYAQALRDYLKKYPEIESVDIAGSYRRCKEVVGDLDVLVIAKKSSEAMAYFIAYSQIAEVVSYGVTRSTVRLKSGLQVDVRVVPKKNYGAALLYLTGSKAHNLSLRKIALKKDLKINEYGLFSEDKVIAGKTEKEIYQKLNLAYVEPELREDRGEIIAAAENKLPKLITLKDIRGDLHAHTNLTDGADSLEKMVLAAIEKNYEYLAITDHSKHLTVAKGLNEKQLLNQIAAINALQENFPQIKILKSIEVDILEDGRLDIADEVLKRLDLTICSIHSQFNLPREQQTQRIIRAMDNPYFTVFAHPSGRLINKRAAYDVDMEKILLAAKERGCCMEINSQPERLDLNDVDAKMAKELGVKLVISSDAHSADQFSHMQFGISQARRAWVEKKDVLNTQPLAKFLKSLSRS